VSERLPTSTRVRVVVAGAVVAGAVAVIWFVAWWVRWRYQSPNVDDYLYTIVAGQIWEPIRAGDLVGAVAAFLNTGQTAPLIPALGAPLYRWGPDAIVLVQLPLLLALTALVFSIVDRVSGVRAAVVAALMTALSAPVLGWSVMVHMALASSVCTLGVIDAYLRSGGFARRAPSALMGVWVGLLAMSRSMAPVYVTMAAVTLLLALVLFHRRAVVARAGHLAIAALTATAVAGPWYWQSGLVALAYLRTAGYAATSGYVVPGNPLRLRLVAMWSDMGAALAVWLLVLAGAVLVQRLRGRWPAASRNGAGDETRFVLFAFAALVTAFLSTTGVGGTGYELPVIVTLIPALILCLPAAGPALKAAATSGLVVAGLAIMQAWLVPGWQGRWGAAPPPFYAREAVYAIGSARRQLSALTEQVGRLVGEQDVFITRDDAIVNYTGLVYYKTSRGLGGRVGTSPYDASITRLSIPATYEFVVTGQSCDPFHPRLERAYLESVLDVEGWSTVWSLRLSPCNEIVLRRRPSLPGAI
jgi:hypothetical protein